jgi:hypothetical protein
MLLLSHMVLGGAKHFKLMEGVGRERDLDNQSLVMYVEIKCDQMSLPMHLGL